MGKPANVKKGADGARKLIEQHQEQQRKAEEAANQPPPDLDAFLSGQGEGSPGTGDQQQQNAGQRQDRDPPANPPASDADLVRENDRLRNRLSVIQGKLDTEIPRMAQQIRDLKEQLKSAPKGDGQNPTDGSGITREQAIEKLKDEFGTEPVDLLLSITQDSGGDSASRQKLEQLEQRIQQNDTQSFQRRLSELVPDWRQIDGDPKFSNEFLYETEGNTGQPKGHFYQQAAQSLDADRCAAFINEFKARRGDPAAAPDLDPPANTGDRQQETGDKPTYKRSEIAAFERAVRNQEYRGQDDKVAEVRRLFRHAAAEGRVVEDMGGL